MPTKLVMTWDVKPGVEESYYEFVVNEFIPKLADMGFEDVHLWYTGYGDGEQILASGTVETTEQLESLLRSDRWLNLHDGLQELVVDYSQKLIPATRGFQL